MRGLDKEPSDRRRAWRWYLSYLFARPKALLIAALPSGFGALMTLPALWLLKYAIDVAIPLRAIGAMLLAAGGIFACRLLAAMVTVGCAKLTMPMARQATAQMRSDLVEQLQRMQWSDFAGFESMRIAGRIVTESERVEQLTQSILYSIAPTLIPAAVFAGVLFYVSPWMALIFLILTPLLHLASRATAKRLRSTIKTFQLDFEQFNVGTHRFVQMLATTRMQACEDNQNAGYRENVARLSRSGAAMAWSGMINSQTNMLVITAIAVTLLITGGIAVARDMMTVGELGTFIFALTQVNSTTSTMIGALSTILGGDEALVRLWALRPLPREAEKRGLPPPRRPWAAIKLEEVSFGYGERRILDRLSMIIPAGETSAIVAPNGFGKTSLLELAGGLHHPAGGRILVDDQDLSRVDCTAWRRHTGFVPQHPAIFRGTIRENICFGRTGIDSAVIDRVIHMAVLDPVLSVVEGGLDAQIGDHGQLLSGGERQRVAIARALIHEPDLLILDEPTNHLDIITINMLIERLFKPRERPTILVATHDQKILAVSDQIHRLLTWDTTRAPEALA